MSAGVARRLSYYDSGEALGVLAPDGWYCFGIYGSGGSALFVSPKPIDEAGFPQYWKDSTGPAIELAYYDGDTSGRFEVAEVIGRVFPAHSNFAISVSKEFDLKPPSLSPYPTDKLTYKSNEIVEYETPAQAEGLGTSSNLRNGSYPISGVAILVGQTPDLVLLSVRLPPDLASRSTAIIEQVEHDTALLAK